RCHTRHQAGHRAQPYPPGPAGAPRGVGTAPASACQGGQRMTQPGGRQWSQVWTAMTAALASAAAEVRAEGHLATDAIVAFVDGELSLSAHERAARHLANCNMCTAEVAAQRQASTAVRHAGAPAVPQALLAALHDIPQSATLPPGPEEL